MGSSLQYERSEQAAFAVLINASSQMYFRHSFLPIQHQKDENRGRQGPNPLPTHAPSDLVPASCPGRFLPVHPRRRPVARPRDTLELSALPRLVGLASPLRLRSLSQACSVRQPALSNLTYPLSLLHLGSKKFKIVSKLSARPYVPTIKITTKPA